jgi:hypothetical protein
VRTACPEVVVRRALAFVLPFGIVVALAVGVGVLASRGPDRAPVVLADVDSLDVGQGRVDLFGQAHYEVVIKQTVPATLFRDEETYWVYGLFVPYDTESRGIPALIRTDRKPESLVHFEMMRVVGRVSRPTPDKIPWNTEETFGKRSNYYFSDEMLLVEPTEIAPFDRDEWVRRGGRPPSP